MTNTTPDGNQTIDLGNNESVSRGVFPSADGTFIALAFSSSKVFKTRRGAEKWLERHGWVKHRGEAVGA